MLGTLQPVDPCMSTSWYETHHLVEIFIENLTPEMRQFLEMMCNGQFDQKTLGEVWEFLELMAENAQK